MDLEYGLESDCSSSFAVQIWGFLIYFLSLFWVFFFNLVGWVFVFLKLQDARQGH